MLVIIAAVVLLNKTYRKSIKELKYRFIGYAFCLSTALVGAINENWLGVLCAFGAFVIFLVGHFAHALMTAKIYENCLNLCCVSSTFVAIYVVIERICFWQMRFCFKF
jgi:hypothetical protein